MSDGRPVEPHLDERILDRARTPTDAGIDDHGLTAAHEDVRRHEAEVDRAAT